MKPRLFCDSARNRLQYRPWLRAILSNAENEETRRWPPLHGNIEDVIGDLQVYAEAGAEHVIMEIAGESFADKFRAMERFMSEVKPRVPD